jgi:hypothetical protein
VREKLEKKLEAKLGHSYTAATANHQRVSKSFQPNPKISCVMILSSVSKYPIM